MTQSPEISEDPRVLQTRSLLREALSELIQTEPPEKISVSQLCKKAGVSRPTFYQHFADVDAAYGALVIDMLSRRMNQEDAPAFSEGLREALTLLIEYIEKSHNFYSEVLSNTSQLNRTRNELRQWLKRKLASFLFAEKYEELKTDEKEKLTFITGGVMASLAEQITQENGKSSAQDTANRLYAYALTIQNVKPMD